MKDPIDIFVICYERTAMLERCLEGIRKYTAGIKHRVVIVEGRRSAAENRNIALSKVTSAWFVMMDDDVVVTPGWLETMLSFIDDKVGQIQPKLLFANGKIFSAEKVFTTPWGDNTVVGMGEKDKGQFNYVRVSELLSGTCCLYNIQVLKTCSFDTDYEGAQWEDCDFSMQIRREGFHLLYCGEAKVHHYNLYRNPSTENFTYFKKKWFGRRELIRRGVLYVGFACDLNCVFCYYKYKQKRDFRPLQELKRECDEFKRFYGNTHVDISGGEPTIYPKIIQLVEHCRAIDLLPTIITHGQRLSKDLVAELKQAGTEDFLISYHGHEKEYDYLVQNPGGYKAMCQGITNVINAGIPFRINTVITNVNYKTLPSLAHEFVKIKTQGVDFIMFNPWESWLSHSLEGFHVRYSDVASYLKEAISILDSSEITSYASFMPFCLFGGFEKCVMNYPQLCFNNDWGWDYKEGHKLRGEYDYLYYALKESRIRYDQGPLCQKCSLRLICSGLPKQYGKGVGWDELRPRGGVIIRDPIHFNTAKAEVTPVSCDEGPLSKYMIADLAKTYPWLKDSDPLILHQAVPFDHLKPLCKPPLVRRVIPIFFSVAGMLGGRWLKRRLPQPVQRWVCALQQRVVS